MSEWPATRSDDWPERVMNRYVLPAMFTAVTGLCLLLMCAAILDGAWVAAAVMLVPPIFLTYVAGECRRSRSPGRRQS